jgi:hypothetical protein
MAEPFKFITKKKYIRLDGWRGYSQPVYAVAGASDTGMASDSPAPSDKVREELDLFKKEMREAGFHPKEAGGSSSNVCMGKHWIIVPVTEYTAAKDWSDKWLTAHESTTRHIHEAD